MRRRDFRHCVVLFALIVLLQISSAPSFLFQNTYCRKKNNHHRSLTVLTGESPYHHDGHASAYTKLAWRLPAHVDGDLVSNLLIEMGSISSEIIPQNPELEWMTITDEQQEEFMKTGRVKTSNSLKNGATIIFSVSSDMKPELLVKSVASIVGGGLDEDEAWASCDEISISKDEEMNSDSELSIPVIKEASILVGERRISLDLSGDWTFGDGKHSSTSVSLKGLEVIARKVQNEKKMKGEDGWWSLLDYGCGSGILALAGLTLCADVVTAVDISDAAIEATQRNLLLNQNSLPPNSKRFVNVTKNFHNDRVGKYDVVIANIPSNTLISLLPTLSAAMGSKDPSYLLLAGYPSTECDLVTEEAEKFNLVEVIDNRMYENGWILQTFMRKRKPDTSS